MYAKLFYLGECEFPWRVIVYRILTLSPVIAFDTSTEAQARTFAREWHAPIYAVQH